MGTEIVEALLALPEIDVNVQDQDEKRHAPLHIACKKRHINIVKALLSHPKIDVNVQDIYGLTPLHYACGIPLRWYKMPCHLLTLTHLLEHPEIDLCIRDNKGKTAFDDSFFHSKTKKLHQK